MSQEANPKPQAYTRKPSQKEAEDCPYLFEDLEAIIFKENPSDVTYYAKWHGQDVWSRISRVRGATRPVTKKSPSTIGTCITPGLSTSGSETKTQSI